MYRTAIEQLRKWKGKKHRKPLIIRGARQVGKTWLMKEFGAKEYGEVVYINFDNNERMKNLFEGSLEVERLVLGMEVDFVVDNGTDVIPVEVKAEINL